MNESGTIVGWVNGSDGTSPRAAFVWSQGHFEELPGLTGLVGGAALSINDRREIVGYLATGIGVFEATSWRRARCGCDRDRLLEVSPTEVSTKSGF